jgi:hypothetical protein
VGDLDFEELDKAVNNLMGKASGIKSDDPGPKTLALNSTLQPGEGPNHAMVQAVANGANGGVSDAQRAMMQTLQSNQPVVPSAASVVDPVQMAGPVASSAELFSTSEVDPLQTPVIPTAPEPVVASTPNPAAVPEPLLAPAPEELPVPSVSRPSTGRFMDVVHPSSDMKSSAPALVVPTRGEMTSPRVSAPVVSEPVIDTPQVVEPAPAEVSVPESVASDLTPEFEETPPLSPFLPDANAKVEKRPLGTAPEAEKAPEIAEISATPDVPVESLFQEGFKSPDEEFSAGQAINGEFDKSISKSEKGEDQRPIDPTSVILPSEKQNQQLQSIESAEVAGADVNSETKPEESAPAPDTKQADVRAVESGDTGHLNSTESSVDKTGDIFDVKNANHPVIQPLKQRSGWLTIVIVVLVIAICVGIAAAAYFVLGLGV